ncbi:hypothetical protein NM688_g128 [Phlebia brevispora]|uniref:Uncharacterized protein n=1 Tax=Phlebia brevispora TaxID=194682 RepID=A0ACC1TFK3_9APHY|nr:hypothetical protein NM688_g128 [Phlebia brevispora]
MLYGDICCLVLRICAAYFGGAARVYLSCSTHTHAPAALFITSYAVKLCAPWFTSLLTMDLADCVHPHYDVSDVSHTSILVFYADHNGRWLTPRVFAYFTPQAAGQHHRIQAIKTDFEMVSVSESVKHTNWKSVDALAAALPSLQTFLLTFYSRDPVFLFHKHIATTMMSNLNESTKLKYAVWQFDRGYTLVSYSDDEVRAIGALSAICTTIAIKMGYIQGAR